MRNKYIMAIDSGTSSCRCIIFNDRCEVVALDQHEFTQYYPQPGWVEHDPEEILNTQLKAIAGALSASGLKASDIAAAGITNQRETTIVWDKATGKPVYNAIVWQCRRTAGLCGQLSAEGLDEIYRQKTGLVIDAYFSATKLAWILENVEGAREKAERGELLFGTVDTWLIWRLTGGAAHVTDMSNASRTMLFNIHTLDWDDDILNRLNIPRAMLPSTVSSSEPVGSILPSLPGGGIVIAGIAGDQQSALFGQRCFKPGDSKNTYGTGCFLLMNTGDTPVNSKNGLITTIAWKLGERVEYALEGSVFVAGAAVQWLRDELGIIKHAADTEAISESVPDTGGCCFVPAFTGLGAPYWDPDARGTLVGLTRGCGRAHIVRAVLESIALQTNDILMAMEEDSCVPLSALRVDGGASANNFLMRYQADISGIRVERPTCVESTALGAASLAGLAAGVWSSRDELISSGELTVFEPSMSETERASRLKIWKRAVSRAGHWADAD